MLNGEIAFTGTGELVLVAGSKVYSVPAPLPDSFSTATIAATERFTMTGVDGNGIAYGDDGYLYISTRGSIVEWDLSGDRLVATHSISNFSPSDMASCYFPGTIAPAERVDIVVEHDAQGAIEGFVGAAEDAEVTRCESDAQAWVGEGTVTNPTAEAQSYRIYVAFNENRDTKGLVQVDVASVAADETAEWGAEAPIAAESLRCVLRVERFSPL